MNEKLTQIVLRYLEQNGLDPSRENFLRYRNIALRTISGKPQANAGGFGALNPNARKRVVKTAPSNKK